jgi:hypothetical protein
MPERSFVERIGFLQIINPTAPFISQSRRYAAIDEAIDFSSGALRFIQQSAEPRQFVALVDHYFNRDVDQVSQIFFELR